MRKPLPPGKFKSYLLDRLRLKRYFEQPGDGRPQAQIPARVLLWSFLIGTLLRRNSFHALESLARSPARETSKIFRKFGNDAQGYFTERLALPPLRQALVSVLRQAKWNVNPATPAFLRATSFSFVSHRPLVLMIGFWPAAAIISTIFSI